MDARQIETRLDIFAKDAGIVPVPPYYIWGEFRIELNGKSLYSDEAHEYCRACADALLAKVLPLLPEDERDDHRVSATELNHEDTPKNCMICGALLDYALNEYGVATELNHYRAYPLTGDLHPGDAFHIARMLEAAPNDRAVLRFGRNAIKSLPVTAGAPQAS
ncbi:hypothetical protein K3M67_06445 [Sphingobium sp. V4]|uniref:hypothetical protein n=1 Tax=Sphingobium sp. V4 TaxID=3038927 RepID=UPI002557DBBF|nr:hypothetical protein [Sphingobium sp. V4]WIW89594.1 hypothetical protein K3M67_06445 [Sphingobium sp. V4]